MYCVKWGIPPPCGQKGASNRVIHYVVKANYSVRPLEFCKESEEKIQSDNQILMDKINNIEPCVVNVNGRDLKVFMQISPTMQCGMVKVILQ